MRLEAALVLCSCSAVPVRQMLFRAIAGDSRILLLYWLGLTVSVPEHTRMGSGSVHDEQLIKYSSQDCQPRQRHSNLELV